MGLLFTQDLLRRRVPRIVGAYLAIGNTPADLTLWADYYAANVWLRLGQPDEALALLEAFLETAPQYREYIASDWMFEELWDDQRFQALTSAGKR